MRMRSELILVHKKSTTIPTVDGNKFLSSCKEGNGLTTFKYQLTKEDSSLCNYLLLTDLPNLSSASSIKGRAER
jgi:hypothetical protein